MINNFKARFRCEQINITQLEDRVTFNFNTKKQYLMSKVGAAEPVNVLLEEYIYKIEPENLSFPIDAMRDMEFAKEGVSIGTNDDGTIARIENFHEISRSWRAFIPKLKETEFYQSIESSNPQAAKDIITGGNKEFGDEETLRGTYDKNLFFHVNFNDTNPDQLEKRSLTFLSQIFVNIPLEIRLEHRVLNEDDYHAEIVSKGILLQDSIDEKEMIRQYDQFYRPVIDYSFSEYVYDYQIVRNVEKKTGLVKTATAVMKEEVKNNYKFLSQFDMKQVEV